MTPTPEEQRRHDDAIRSMVRAELKRVQQEEPGELRRYVRELKRLIPPAEQAPAMQENPAQAPAEHQTPEAP